MEAFQLRLWDSRIGRWLSPDPAKQYFSPYLGMGNNPINGVDPDGGCFIKNDDGTFSKCIEGDIGSTAIGHFGNEWTLGESGYQLTNGADPSTVNAVYTPVDANGSAQYYVDRYKQHIKDNNTRPPDYLLEYGYNNRAVHFEGIYDKLSDGGQKWFDQTAVGLQDMIEIALTDNPGLSLDDSAFTKYAFDTHPDVYMKKSLMITLPLTDIWHIGWAPPFKDVFSYDGIRQGIDLAPEYAIKKQIYEGIKVIHQIKNTKFRYRPRFF